MPATRVPAPIAELVRQGRITDALTALGERDEPGVEALCLALECRLARGEMEQAIRIGQRLAESREGGVDDRRIAMARGELCGAIGRDEDALACFREVADLAGGDDDPVAFPWRSEAALSLTRLGRRHEAEALADEQLYLARASGSTYAVASAIRTVAAVCIAPDHHERLREAHEMVAGTYLRLAAQVATDLAGVVTLLGSDPASHAEALRLLRGAEAYADAEDLWPLHARIRRLLERLGEPARVPRSEALARLTEAERRIARMAAQGETNRSIAEHLGVTVKAVEWHLSHTYRKLDISGRTQLPHVLRID